MTAIINKIIPNSHKPLLAPMADITKSNIEHDANSTNNTKDDIIKEIRQNKHMNLSILKIQLSERN